MAVAPVGGRFVHPVNESKNFGVRNADQSIE
jgi:hypothetical protein